MSGAAFAFPMDRGWRIALVLAPLVLAGCASLSSDLQSAEAKCTPAPAMTGFVTCLNSMDEPVWQKESPENEPAYRDFAAARLSLAEDLDSGKITPQQFSRGTADARAKFAALLISNARARQAQLDHQRAEEEVDGLQKMPTMGASGMGGGMGDMNGMNGMGM
jgi:hypothetical protein